jgi:hypothetical protein
VRPAVPRVLGQLALHPLLEQLQGLLALQELQALRLVDLESDQPYEFLYQVKY